MLVCFDVPIPMYVVGLFSSFSSFSNLIGLKNLGNLNLISKLNSEIVVLADCSSASKF